LQSTLIAIWIDINNATPNYKQTFTFTYICIIAINN
jgi:hypothetical protein